MTEAEKKRNGVEVDEMLGEFAKRVADGERTAELFGVDDGFLHAALQKAYQFYSDKRFDKAAALLRGVTALDCKNAYAHLLLGDVLLQQSEFDEAATMLERARELDPDNPQALAKLGESYVRLDRCEEAVIVLERALEALDEASSHHKRATVLLQVARPGTSSEEG